MAERKLKRCPFCGAEEEVCGNNPLQFGTDPESWVFEHYCSTDPSNLTTVVRIYGATAEETLDRWNGRRRTVKEG